MSFRRNPQVWDNQSVANATASQDISVGASPYVAIMIQNHTASPATLTVEVGANDGQVAGRNQPSESWFPYTGADAISVPASSKVSIDLSPFAPHNIRLVNNSGGARTLSAYIAISR